MSSKRHARGFWLIAFTFLSAMAFSTIPAPLYVLYQQRDGFGSFTVTVIFAAYAVGVVISLLLAGHISDWVGRRRVLLPAVLFEIVAALLFLAWDDLTGLLVARLLTGIGVGMLTATATAALQELYRTGRPEAKGARSEVVATVANIGGLGVGPLVAGFLAEYVTAPLRTPYVVFLVILVVDLVLIVTTPETAPRPDPRPRYRPQRLSVGTGDKTTFVAAAASAFTAFAVFGFFTSLAPAFVSGTLGHPSRFLAGVVSFSVFGAAALAQIVSARASAALRQRLGLGGEAVGLVVIGIGMQTETLAPFLVGGVIAGCAAGMLFKMAIGTVSSLATPETRGERLAGLFFIGYLGLIVPVIGLGVATRSIAEETAMMWFTAIFLVVLAAVAYIGRRQPTQRQTI